MLYSAVGKRFEETMVKKDFYQLAKLLVNRDNEYVIRLEEARKTELPRQTMARRLAPRPLFATVQHCWELGPL
jgi:hypothetical protein